MNGPTFVGWHELVRRIQRSQVHFDFIVAACKNRRTATWAKKSSRVVACFAFDCDRIQREHSRRIKKRPVMLAAIKAVT